MTFFNFEQSLKAQFPIEVTEEGISISANVEHWINEESPIVVTEEGIAICVNEGISKNDKFTIDGFNETKVMFFNDLHSKKALYFTCVEEERNTIPVNCEQWQNANFPIEVTEEGIVICIKFEQ